MVEAVIGSELDRKAHEVDLESGSSLHQAGRSSRSDPSEHLHQGRYLSYKKGKQANLDRLKS